MGSQTDASKYLPGGGKSSTQQVVPIPFK